MYSKIVANQKKTHKIESRIIKNIHMALVESHMIPLGMNAPDFTLIDTISGESIHLNNDPSLKATVIVFICNHCPYVQPILRKLVEIADHYQNQGVQFYAISSNDADHYPADAPDEMKAHAERYGFSFPYLYDETQAIAKAYQAECTPDFFLFDDKFNCIYRGRFDASRPGNTIPVTGSDLVEAIQRCLERKPIIAVQYPSIGCSIKWKK